MPKFWKNKLSGIVWEEVASNLTTGCEVVKLQRNKGKTVQRLGRAYLKSRYDEVTSEGTPDNGSVQYESLVVPDASEFRAVVAQLIVCNAFGMLPHDPGHQELLRAKRVLLKLAGLPYPTTGEAIIKNSKAAQEYTYLLPQDELAERFPQG